VVTQQRKGHRQIVLAQGPARPIRNTQAVPVLPKGKRAPTFLRLRISKIAGFETNAKSTVTKPI